MSGGGDGDVHHPGGGYGLDCGRGRGHGLDFDFVHDDVDDCGATAEWTHAPLLVAARRHFRPDARHVGWSGDGHLVLHVVRVSTRETRFENGAGGSGDDLTDVESVNGNECENECETQNETASESESRTVWEVVMYYNC